MEILGNNTFKNSLIKHYFILTTYKCTVSCCLKMICTSNGCMHALHAYSVTFLINTVGMQRMHTTVPPKSEVQIMHFWVKTLYRCSLTIFFHVFDRAQLLILISPHVSAWIGQLYRSTNVTLATSFQKLVKLSREGRGYKNP